MAGRKTTKAAPQAAPQAPSAKQDDAITRLSEMLAQALLANKPHVSTPDKLWVGVRNVSSDAIGIPAAFGEPAISLNPTRDDQHDPHAAQPITFTRWQSLRKGALYRFGMIVRDDSILGDVHVTAPEDRPEELAPEHAQNVVLDPVQWIDTRNEAEIRDGIAKMTSEPSLRRLWRVVDDKVAALQIGVDRRDAKAMGHVVAALPAAYQLVERLVQDRLEELNPRERTGADGA